MRRISLSPHRHAGEKHGGLPALADFLRWAAYHAAHDGIRAPADSPLFVLSPRLVASRFGIAGDPAHAWVVVARREPSLRWFVEMPWSFAKGHPGKGSLGLVAGGIVASPQGEILPALALVIPVTRTHLARLDGLSALAIGLIDDRERLTQVRTIPFEMQENGS